MGTNYYLGSEGDKCQTCGHEKPRRHIGKSSVGWVFSLRIYPDENIRTLDDWRKLWAAPGSLIEDEYGERVTPEQMDSCVTKRVGSSFSGFNFEQNHAEPGPKGLARHRLGGFGGAVAHGDGTWSYFDSEFS